MDELTEFEQQLSDVRAQIEAANASQSSEIDELRVLETELADLVAELRKCAQPEPKGNASKEPLKDDELKGLTEKKNEEGVKPSPKSISEESRSRKGSDLGSLPPPSTKQLIAEKPVKPAPVDIQIPHPTPQPKPQSSVTLSKWRKNAHSSTLASRTAPPRPGKVAKQQTKPRRHFVKEPKP